MSQVRIAAEARTEFGKGASRRNRRDGLIPAVLYGHGTDTRHLTLNAREFGRALKSGANTVLTLVIGGEEELALPKVVIRHPLRDYIEHADLVLIRRGEKVTVDVPIVVTGEAAPDTMVITEQDTISIEVEALHIPSSIEVSVEGLEAGSQILASDLVLPAGATLDTDPESVIVVVAQPEPSEPEADAATESAS